MRTHSHSLACIRPVHSHAPSSGTGVRVLVDPWFYGDLVFAEQDWMFRAKKKYLTPENVDVKEIMAETDLLVISQVRAEPIL